MGGKEAKTYHISHDAVVLLHEAVGAAEQLAAVIALSNNRVGQLAALLALNDSWASWLGHFVGVVVDVYDIEGRRIGIRIAGYCALAVLQRMASVKAIRRWCERGGYLWVQTGESLGWRLVVGGGLMEHKRYEQCRRDQSDVERTVNAGGQVVI